MTQLVNIDKTGYIQRIEPLEREIFMLTDEKLATWRENPPQTSEIENYYEFLNKKYPIFTLLKKPDDKQTIIRQHRKILPKDQIFTDEILRLVKGTDAGLYRLVPKVVVKVDSEAEVTRLLTFCNTKKYP